MTVAGTKMRSMVFVGLGLVVGVVATLVGALWMVLGVGRFEGSEHFYE